MADLAYATRSPTEADSGLHNDNGTNSNEENGDQDIEIGGDGNLNTNYDSSDGTIPVHRCEKCENYETLSHTALLTHMSQCQGAADGDRHRKMFECDVCNMKFSNGANMRRHKMRHTGVKPYECRVCQKRFFRKDHLAEHFTTHTKTLPFHCPICNRGFQRQIAMRAHFQNEHVGQHDMIKSCPLCSYRAGSMKSLRVHFFNRHGIDLDNPGPSTTNGVAGGDTSTGGGEACSDSGDSTEARSTDNATPPMHFLTPHVEISMTDAPPTSTSFSPSQGDQTLTSCLSIVGDSTAQVNGSSSLTIESSSTVEGPVSPRSADSNSNGSKEATAKELAESVDLLLQLDEPAEALCLEFLSHAENRLKDQLELMQNTPCQDLIEFVDLGSNGFLSDLCFVVTSYNDMFISRPACCDAEAGSKLNQFVFDNMHQYFDLVQNRIEAQQDGGDSGILVRALDRFYRRLNAVNSLFPDDDFINTGMEVVMRAGRRQCRAHLHGLKTQLTDSLSDVRQALAAPRLIAHTTPDTTSPTTLSTELLTQLVLATVEKVKGVLQDLLVFIQPDLAFAAKPKFLEAFCVDSVREGLVVGFIHHLTATARSFCSANVPSLPLLLILSKMCLEFEATNIHYLLSVTDEWFNTDAQGALLTAEKEMCAGMRLAAQELLNHYVRMQGQAISQMLRKSVETRDWLHSLEPRTVRAVMKRVMEEMATIDSQVGMLFEEGSHTERSSDSSHKTQSRLHRSTASNWSTHSHNLAASHIHKLFSERIEIFAPVQFTRASILTGVIKISLKTLLECIRLRTFSRYGLQQIQVDSHYLQLYLWRYVADENLVQFLLDEILSSAVHRCLDPVLMEPSVVDIICERG